MMMHKEIYHVLVVVVKTLPLSVLASIVLLYASQMRSILRRSKWKLSGRRLPPGPNPWPLVGNLPSIVVNPTEALVNLARIYGPVMSFQMGTLPAVIFSSSKVAREVLKTHDSSFGYRPASVALETSLEGIASAHREHTDDYKSVKKVLAVELMSNRRLDDTKFERAEETALALRALVESTDKRRQAGDDPSATISHYFSQIGGNVVTRAVFGQRLFTTANSNFEEDGLVNAVKETLRLLSVYDFRDVFPFFKKLDLQGNSKQIRAANNKLQQTLAPLIHARRETLQKGSRGCNQKQLLDVLLLDDSTERSMPDSTKMNVITGMLLAMVNASGSITDWAISELLRNPDVLKKCQQQLGRVVGPDRLVSESDLPNLPFMRAILLESMRLHPLSAYMPRHSLSDCEVGGYFIPANTMIILNVPAINRDPTIWADPHEFIPDQHLKRPVRVWFHTTLYRYADVAFVVRFAGPKESISKFLANALNQGNFVLTL